MKVKRLFAGVLAAALLASLAVLPAGAAGSSFADVSDAATAVNADILRLMGVVSGVGGNRFNPGAGLTRADADAAMQRLFSEERMAYMLILPDGSAPADEPADE